MSDFNTDPYPPRWLFMLLALVGLGVAGVILFAAL
jgi:CHASE1-domain containing sensor protein